MEIKKSAMQIWREKNREKLRNIDEKIRMTEKRKQYMKEFRKKNIKNKRAVNQKHNWDRKIRLLTIVANGKELECVRCKIKDKRVLQLHHKHGNGKRNPKEYLNLDRLIKTKSDKTHISIDELEIRCCNCNILAEYEELGRRWSNVERFDENFDPVWKELPKKIKPLEPLNCDNCGVLYMPSRRRKHKYHYCSQKCYWEKGRRPQ